MLGHLKILPLNWDMEVGVPEFSQMGGVSKMEEGGLNPSINSICV